MRLGELEELLTEVQPGRNRAQGSISSGQQLSLPPNQRSETPSAPPLVTLLPEPSQENCSLEDASQLNSLPTFATPTMGSWDRMDMFPEVFDWNFAGIPPTTAHDRSEEGPPIENGITGSAEDAFESNPLHSFDGARLEDSALSPVHPITQSAGATAVSPFSTSSVTTESSLTGQIATLHGRLHMAEDGQLRYYGATSNMHLFPNGIMSLFQHSVRSVRTHGEEALRNAGLSWKVDENYTDHLTNLFFSWHASVLQEVDRSIYSRERQKYQAGFDTGLYSPTLENAM